MQHLTLCIPSNRDLRQSANAIETALVYAEKTNCNLVVSDNSGDPAKRIRYENCSPRLTYVVPEGNDGLVNMVSALAKVETPFLFPMGDDDEIYSLDDRQIFDFSTVPDDVIGVRPQTFIWTKEKGVYRADRFQVVADEADRRLLEYNEKATGTNNLYYSAYRSHLFKGLFSLFASSHPTGGGYCDWALSFAFCAAGKFLYDAATIYRYDLGRWAIRKDMEQAKVNLYLNAGLPAEAELFSPLLRFVDTHVLLTWTGLPLSDDARHKALMTNARLTLRAFLQDVEKSTESYDPEVVYLAEVIAQTADLATVFQIALLITDRLKAGLAEKYVNFSRIAAGGPAI